MPRLSVAPGLHNFSTSDFILFINRVLICYRAASSGDTMLYRKPVPQNHGEFHLIAQEIKKDDLIFVILIAKRRGEQDRGGEQEVL
ncbi:hypothetical protein NUBL21974_34600 [Klebsiella quasipneumoniae]|nr:hypothetical protein NUBL21974_34600 [Klebsiella quasipneumoniae]